jgi:hypothetical protein
MQTKLLAGFVALVGMVSGTQAGNRTVYDDNGNYYYGNWNGQNGYLYDNGGNYRYYYGTNAPGHYIYDEDGNTYYIYGR